MSPNFCRAVYNWFVARWRYKCVCLSVNYFSLHSFLCRLFFFSLKSQGKFQQVSQTTRNPTLVDRKWFSLVQCTQRGIHEGIFSSHFRLCIIKPDLRIPIDCVHWSYTFSKISLYGNSIDRKNSKSVYSEIPLHIRNDWYIENIIDSLQLFLVYEMLKKYFPVFCSNKLCIVWLKEKFSQKISNKKKVEDSMKENYWNLTSLYVEAYILNYFLHLVLSIALAVSTVTHTSDLQFHSFPSLPKRIHVQSI